MAMRTYTRTDCAPILDSGLQVIPESERDSSLLDPIALRSPRSANRAAAAHDAVRAAAPLVVREVPDAARDAVAAIKVDALQASGSREVSTIEMGPNKGGALQLGTDETSARERGVVEVGADDGRLREVGSVCKCPSEQRLLNRGANQRGLAEIDPLGLYIEQEYAIKQEAAQRGAVERGVDERSGVKSAALEARVIEAHILGVHLSLIHI